MRIHRTMTLITCLVLVIVLVIIFIFQVMVYRTSDVLSRNGIAAQQKAFVHVYDDCLEIFKEYVPGINDPIFIELFGSLMTEGPEKSRDFLLRAIRNYNSEFNPAELDDVCKRFEVQHNSWKQIVTTLIAHKSEQDTIRTTRIGRWTVDNSSAVAIMDSKILGILDWVVDRSIKLHSPDS